MRPRSHTQNNAYEESPFALPRFGQGHLEWCTRTSCRYASANFGWTWLWYVAGIVTGATIIFMFALFEKKRTEVLRVVEGLKALPGAPTDALIAGQPRE